MRKLVMLTGAPWLALLPAEAAAADRARAQIDCKATQVKLVYDCTIALRNARSGAPISGAEVVVGADMPSMPMAHNVKPAKGVPAADPGKYGAQLHLEMLGDWAVHVTVSGPVRDRIVEVLSFTDKGAAPAKGKPKAGGGHGQGGHKGH